MSQECQQTYPQMEPSNAISSKHPSTHCPDSLARDAGNRGLRLRSWESGRLSHSFARAVESSDAGRPLYFILVDECGHVRVVAEQVGVAALDHCDQYHRKPGFGLWLLLNLPRLRKRMG